MGPTVIPLWLLIGASLLPHSTAWHWYYTTTEDSQTTEYNTAYVPNVITTPPRDQAVRVGSSTTFSCTVTWISGEYVEWRYYNDSSELSYRSGMLIYRSNIGMVGNPGKYYVDSSYSLRVNYATLDDAGFYRCGFYYRNQYYSAELTVIQKVSCSPYYGTVYASGSRATLGCSAAFGGSSPPDLTWTLTGGTHRKSNESNLVSYTIEKTVYSWMSYINYYCNLRFQKGSSSTYTDSCYVYLYVYDLTTYQQTHEGSTTEFPEESTPENFATDMPPNIVTTPPTDQAVRVGSSAYFYCNVTRLSGEYLEWRFFNESSDTAYGTGTLIYRSNMGVVQNPSKYEVLSWYMYRLSVKYTTLHDAGFYRCGLYYRNQHYSAELTVMEKVSCSPPIGTVSYAGSRVILGCTVAFGGSSPPDLTWTLTGGKHTKTNLTGLVSYSIERTVDYYMDYRNFYCNLRFQKETSQTYTDSCYTRLHVYYSATTEEMTTYKQEVTTGITTPLPSETTFTDGRITTDPGNPNVITTTPRDLAVRLGSSAYFYCSVTRLDKEHFEWRLFVNSSDPSDSGSVIYITGIGVQDSSKYEVDSSYRLRVKNVQKGDAGSYRCGLHVKQKYYTAELTVMDKVSCSPPYGAAYHEGGTATLACSVAFGGSTAPTLTWSSSLSDGIHNKSVEAGYVRYTVERIADAWMDYRWFSCSLRFKKGSSATYSDSCSTYIRVYVPTRNVTILYNNVTEVSRVVHAQEGDTFHCYAEGDPPPFYYWVKSQGPEPNSRWITDGNVLAVNSTMSHGLHEYTCIASNVIGGVTYTPNKTISFFINDAPMYVVDSPKDTIVMANARVTLKCSVNEDAGKGWLEWWFRGSQKLFASNRQDTIPSGYEINGTYDLVIDKVAAGHSGRYECRLFPNNTRFTAELVVLTELKCDRSLVASIPNSNPAHSIDDVINNELALQTMDSSSGWNGNTWVPRTGQYVQVTCSLSYDGNLGARVLWHNEETGDMQVYYSQIGHTIKANAYIVASARYHNKLFSCRAERDATNRQEDEAISCSGRMPVNFLQNLRITPDSSEAYGGALRLNTGDEIVCQADGNPQPRLAWQRVAGSGADKIDGGVLKTTEIMKRSLNIYECHAWTDDGDIEMEKRKLSHFYVV